MRNRIKQDGKISLKLLKKLIKILIKKGVIKEEDLNE